MATKIEKKPAYLVLMDLIEERTSVLANTPSDLSFSNPDLILKLAIHLLERIEIPEQQVDRIIWLLIELKYSVYGKVALEKDYFPKNFPESLAEGCPAPKKKRIIFKSHDNQRRELFDTCRDYHHAKYLLDLDDSTFLLITSKLQEKMPKECSGYILSEYCKESLTEKSSQRFERLQELEDFLQEKYGWTELKKITCISLPDRDIYIFSGDLILGES